MENHFDGLAAGDLLDVTIDDVGQHARAFFQLDIGQHVGQVTVVTLAAAIDREL